MSVLFICAAVLLAVPAAVLLLQVSAALLLVPVRQQASLSRPRLAVLIPAHDEAEVIAATLRSIAMQIEPGDRLLVVADNCSDDTAKIAAAAGAQVVERHDAERRGKGYALDFGVGVLRDDPPEVLIVIDADCVGAPGAIGQLASCCLRTGRPVQALDLMLAPEDAGPPTRIAAFAWQLKNQIRPLGGMSLGMPCPLMGTGMAFPWAIAARMPLANGSIVEDLQLGLELVLAGQPPVFCPEALVVSYFPGDRVALAKQRERWEHGYLSVLTAMLPRLLFAAAARARPVLLAVALDLLVPPIALLVLVTGGAAVLSLGLFALGDAGPPVLLATMPVVMTLGAVGLAWAGWGRRNLPISALLAVPAYLLGKLPMYARYCSGRQQHWVKTARK